MSSAQFNAGQSHGQAKSKTEEWIDSTKSTANAAHEKACDAAGQTQQEAQGSKEEAAGFLQQTGEKMTNMAQGAIDGVKNTLGMNDK